MTSLKINNTKESINAEMTRMYNILDIIGMRDDVNSNVCHRIWQVQMRIRSVQTGIEFIK